MENTKVENSLPQLLQSDIENNSLRQSYLISGRSFRTLQNIASTLSKHFNIADIFTLKLREDKQSIGVEDTLDFMSKLQFASIHDKKLMIVTDMSLLTPAAQNKMLKGIEDVRNDTVFLILCTNPERVLATIKSRCVIINIETADERTHPKSDEIVKAATRLVNNTKSLDDALSVVQVLCAKDNMEFAFYAITKVVRDEIARVVAKNDLQAVKRLYNILDAIATARRNILANCNAQNAFDLVIMACVG